MKVALCIPIHDQAKALFTMSTLALQAHTFKVRPDIEIQGHMHHKCSRIEQAREVLAQTALEGGAEWLLWLDSDHTFPADALLRLIAHQIPFVGCNYRKRIPDRVESACRNLVGDRALGIEPKQEGIDAVDLIGFGLTLTSAAIFSAVPRPWFESGPYGEDGYFSIKSASYGYPPFVDHALSMDVGHIAETVLKFP